MKLTWRQSGWKALDDCTSEKVRRAEMFTFLADSNVSGRLGRGRFRVVDCKPSNDGTYRVTVVASKPLIDDIINVFSDDSYVTLDGRKMKVKTYHTERD